MSETVVIGLDAATWRIIDPMIEDGDLPNINALINDGTRGSLSTTIPPMTPLAWTSMATGINPGGHGIFDFLNMNEETREISPVDFSEMDTPAIWDVLSHEERSAGFVNFPLAHPPRQVDPFFIGGIPAHAKQEVAYPEEVQQYLNEISYDVHPHVDPEVDPEGFYRAVQELTEVQAEATIELVERYDPSLLWVVFMGLDWIQHHFWDEELGDENPVQEFYRFIDGVIGDLLKVVDSGGNVCLVSDHGARHIEGVIHMNSVLNELDYLKVDTPETGFVEDVRSAVLNATWSLGGHLPPALKRAAKRHTPASIQDEMRTAAGAGQRGMDERIDWERTEAFSYGYMGRIFLNTEDRFDDGGVPDDQIARLRKDVATDLSALTHPGTGERIFETVCSREEIYDGEHADEAADLIAIPSGWEYSILGDFGSEWIHPPETRIADHDSEGIFVLSGPDVAADKGVAIDVTDVTPTLLYLAGLPVLDKMEGDIRSELLTNHARSKRSIDYLDTMNVSNPSSSTSEAEQSEVEERLEDLGYM
jgi:predicted AlkP superfamily phosphohydrolase/phosphomutase